MMQRLIGKTRWLGVVALLILSCAAFSNRAGGDASDSRTMPLKVGSTAPDFTLKSHLDRDVSPSADYGKKKTVLVFYRGHW
jgi:hypothetical protein